MLYSIALLVILHKNCHLQLVYYNHLILEAEVVMDLPHYFLMTKTVTSGARLFCSVKGTAGAWYKFKDLILLFVLPANVNALFAVQVIHTEWKVFWP